MKSKKSKKTDISQKVKKIVWERDGQRCIFCGNRYAMPNAHVISRKNNGLGIEQNIVTACYQCHFNMDQTIRRKEYLEKANAYLDSIYEPRNNLIYEK